MCPQNGSPKTGLQSLKVFLETNDLGLLRTAVPFWGQMTWNFERFVPKTEVQFFSERVGHTTINTAVSRDPKVPFLYDHGIRINNISHERSLSLGTEWCWCVVWNNRNGYVRTPFPGQAILIVIRTHDVGKTLYIPLSLLGVLGPD